MALKSQSIVVQFLAWDTANNVGKTGDSGNFTLRVIKDGTASIPTNSPSEVDSTNCPGVYKITLTADEMAANTITLAGKSSTEGVTIIPVNIVTESGRLDATVSSRSTLAASDVWATSPRTITDKTGFSLTSAYDSAKLAASQTSVDAVKTDTSAIKTKTDNIPSHPAQEGTLSTVHGKVNSILEDTNMLQTDWVNGGRLDLLVDGIKAKTDVIPASPAAVGSKMDIVDNPSLAGKTALANANADQVWDEAASGHAAPGSTGALLSLVHSILGGKQQIVNNQLICYAADNTTEVARFNLFDSEGNPTMVNVYLRNRV